MLPTRAGDVIKGSDVGRGQEGELSAPLIFIRSPSWQRLPCTLHSHPSPDPQLYAVPFH